MLTVMIQVLVLLFVQTFNLNKLFMSNILWVVYYVSVGSVLIPIIAYFFIGKRNRLRNIILIILVASFISDVGTRIYVVLGHRGYLISNIFIVVQIMLLCLIYIKMLSNNFL